MTNNVFLNLLINGAIALIFYLVGVFIGTRLMCYGLAIEVTDQIIEKETEKEEETNVES